MKTLMYDLLDRVSAALLIVALSILLIGYIARKIWTGE